MSDNAAAPPMPKIDTKTIVLLGCLLIQKKIDFTNPDILNTFRTVFISMIVVVATVYYLVYTSINKKQNKTKIWVPPKPVPSIPFLPAPEPEKKEEHKETTYFDHEMSLLQANVGEVLMACGIAAFMTFKMNIHVSLMSQCILLPLGLWENLLVKQHVLGIVIEKPYKELTSPPESTPAVTPEVKEEEEEENVPRVEELSDEEPTPAQDEKDEDSDTVLVREEDGMRSID